MIWLLTLAGKYLEIVIISVFHVVQKLNVMKDI